MGGGCTFIRLLADEDKGVALRDAIDALQNGEVPSAVFSIDPEKFSMVPRSPFAYWVSDRIRRLFMDLPPFENDERNVRVGLQTSDDFRFVRAWWEVAPARLVSGTPETTPEEFRAQTFSGKKWVPFAKGGEYSPYYADVHLVVNWSNAGQEIKNRINPDSGRPYSNVWMLRDTEENLFFRPGLTWPRRTTSGISIRLLNSGVIFGDKGPVCFINDIAELSPSIGLAQSSAYSYLINLQVAAADAAARSYEVGIIQKTPMPEINVNQKIHLTCLITQILKIKREIEKTNELNHLFNYPPYIQCKNESITKTVDQWALFINNSINEGNIIQNQIDEISFNTYGLCDSDKNLIRKASSNRPSPINAPQPNVRCIAADFLSYSLGTIFGRWDVRYATGEREPPELPDPFAPLPACSPGMLQGDDGLPLDPHEIPPDYPLKVDPDGILVDDEGHPDDIIARIRDVLALIWGDRADAIEKEACEILGVKSLRDYFRKPSAGGFWDDHVKRYSKSRRKAPIYWLLQSAKKNYGIWIYYPRMDGDTLYKALRYAKDKLAMEERRLEDLRKEREQSGTGGAVVKKMEKEIDGQEAFISELHDFVEKLERAASLNLIPEHDDGVVLTIAPLRELVPWNEPKNYWGELIEGKYAWSSIGKQLAEKGLVKR
ncbi:MAG: hypothetical protein QMC96_11885 [Methanomicrobiales archaeon]|nr:hypothetical protein [Methanomicrobiales archaeon]